MSINQNNALCDIYIGKHAGKKLLEDVQRAQLSFKIISPYLSPSLVKEIINLHKKGIDVKLITSDNIEDYKNQNQNKNIYDLIQQTRTTNKKSDWLRKTILLLANLLFLLALFGLAGSYFLYIRGSDQLYLVLGGSCFLGILCLLLRYKSKKIRIYNYSYKQLFSFKVLDSQKGSTFVHSKIYIIDDDIAYLGSLNFTANGTRTNHETRIRTIDPEAVKKIVWEFDNLFYDSKIPSFNIQEWGSMIYEEPIN